MNPRPIRSCFRWLLLAALGAGAFGEPVAKAGLQPNFLWISSDDNGPQLGCYGDAYATTPHLDALACKGMRFDRVWSVAPVCAPARTALITGIYPSSLGAEHMRSLVPLPAGARFLPEYLRESGYYCSNNSKEDYNVSKRGLVWGASSPRAHWRDRKPGQPFFAVFNHTQSHESQVRARPHKAVHDPALVRIPAYHPDTPETRRDWAQYYDQLTVIDARAGQNLRELEAAGLAEDTIVVYFADHGPGMPRCKRSACDSGLRVPLLIYVPEKFRRLAGANYSPQGASDRPVSFVDLAPTMLSLAGLKPPPLMQGRPFLGPFAGAAPRYLHGLRGRMDERLDLVRSVRDERFVYVRNFMPHKPAGQHVAYMFETPTTRAWRQLFDTHPLPPAQRRFWEPKDTEELYDLRSDPDEVVNLAALPAYRNTLARLRREARRHAAAIRDVGLLPEAEMLRRSEGGTPYDLGHSAALLPWDRVASVALEATAANERLPPRWIRALSDPEPAVRFWAAVGVRVRGQKMIHAQRSRLHSLLADSSPSVRVAAAEALARSDDPQDRERAVSALLDLSRSNTPPDVVAIEALNALDDLPTLPDLVHAALPSIPGEAPGLGERYRTSRTRLLEHLRSRAATASPSRR